ncbi:hypothetical protein HDV01_003448 [Terramyces sp. JEL0728]|nr:hypothetical protein HDV01_003448 [Terramyces sp. JEL0728]
MKILLVASVACSWPSKILAPYVDVTIHPRFDIDIARRQTGIQYYTIGPIYSDNSGYPAWQGNITANSTSGFYTSTVSNLRNNGGDVIISFGSEDGFEIAANASSTDDLVAKYQSVITAYSASYITFYTPFTGYLDDFEKTNNRRSEALATLQKNNPNLKVSFTLPSDTTGIDIYGMQVLKSAGLYNVAISSINVVAGDYACCGSNGTAVKSAISAIEGTKGYISQTKMPNVVYGIVPVIGKNGDVVFGLDDAKQLVDYANQAPWIGLFSYRNMNRDTNLNGTVDHSSLIQQDLFGFATIFKSWAGITSATDTSPLPSSACKPFSWLFLLLIVI